MNDQDRQLLADVLHQAGTVGAKGFDYVVRLQVVDGVTSFVGFSLAIVGGVWCLRRAFAWNPNDSGADIPRGVIIGVLCLAIFGFLCGAMSGLTQIMAPEGAAIMAVLHKA